MRPGRPYRVRPAFVFAIALVVACGRLSYAAQARDAAVDRDGSLGDGVAATADAIDERETEVGALDSDTDVPAATPDVPDAPVTLDVPDALVTLDVLAESAAVDALDSSTLDGADDSGALEAGDGGPDVTADSGARTCVPTSLIAARAFVQIGGSAIHGPIIGATEAAVAVADDGTVFVAGTYGGGLLSVPPSSCPVRPGLSAFVLRVPTSGSPVLRCFPGPAGDLSVRAITIDQAGEVLIGATASGVIDFGPGPTAFATGTGVIAGLDPLSLATLWQKDLTPMPGGASEITSLVTTPTEIFVTGMLYGQVRFDAVDVTSAGQNDILLVSLDRTTRIARWGRRFGNFDFDGGGSLDIDPGTNTLLLAGWFGGDVDFGGGFVPRYGDLDGFAAAFDATTGTHRWSWSVGAMGTSSHIDVVSDIARVGRDAPTRVVALAEVNSDGGAGEPIYHPGGMLTPGWGADVAVLGARLSDGAAVTAPLSVMSGSDDRVGGIASTCTGYIVAGSTIGPMAFGGGAHSPIGGSDVYVMLYDGAGGYAAGIRYGGTDDEHIVSLAVNEPGTHAAAVSRFTSTTASAGGTPIASTGTEDLLVQVFLLR